MITGQAADGQTKNSPAPALERGLALLEVLVRMNGEAGFKELVHARGIPRASAARLLKVLRDAGYVVRDPRTGRYRIGARTSMLASTPSPRERLLLAAGPVLRSLVRAAGNNTVLLLFWNGMRAECIAKGVHENSMMMRPVGSVTGDLGRHPWGWLMYRTLGRSERAAALRRMEQRRQFEKLWPKNLAYIESHGFAYDDYQSFPRRRIAAPVCDSRGRLIACLCAGGAAESIPDRRVDEIGAVLLDYAATLRAAMESPAGSSPGVVEAEVHVYD